MDIQSMFPIIGSIAVITFVIAEIVKLIPKVPNKVVPVISAISGGILGFIGYKLGISDFVSLNSFDAIGTGICSGLAASGAFSLFKNITGQYEKELI